MRKTLLLVAFMACAFAGKAQIEKGKWIGSLGFSGDFNSGSLPSVNETSKRSYYDISIQGGHFITDKFMIGLGLGYLHNNRKEHYSDGSSIDDRSEALNTFLYFQNYKQIKKHFFYSPSGSFDFYKESGKYTRTEATFESTESGYRNNNFGIRINPLQFTYSVNKKLVLETGLGYILFGKRDAKVFNPNGVEPGNATTLTFNFQPFISNIRISYIF